MMEESKSVGEQSLRQHSPPPSPTTVGDSTTQVAPMAAIKPIKLSNGLNGVHPDGGLANKFSYWRGHAIWGRSSESPNSPGRNREFDPSRILIDTAAPFESVKVAANKFGGTADWKAQRVLSLERNRNVQQGLEKMEQELALYQKQAESVEEAKERVLQELEGTRRFVDELRLRLDKAHTEEAQAKQDSELSQLRVKEMEQGIGDEASVAAKAQVNVAKARYMEAVDELRSVDNELEVLRMDYDRLDEERNNVKKKAEEAILASEESEKKVEELTLELISMKETLELAQASHVEAEEQKFNAAMDTEEEPGNWEQQMQQAQEELRSLDEQISEAIDLELRLVTASVFLSSLKLQSEKLEEDTLRSNQAALASAKELEEVKASIENSKEEVICLKAEAKALMSKLETETNCMAVQKQRKAELEEKAQKLMEEVIKSKRESARLELEKAKEEAELANARQRAVELKLQAVTKEIEAVKASEKSALETIRALQESEDAVDNGFEDSPKIFTITLEEYDDLKAKAIDAENLANERVSAAMEKIKEAKEKEAASLERMEAIYKEMKEKEEALKDATLKAEEATEGKLETEQMLREWREQELKCRKESDAAEEGLSNTVKCCYSRSFDGSRDSNSFPSAITVRASTTPNLIVEHSSAEAGAPLLKITRKKSFFPRIVMFFARKKVQALK